MLNQILLGDCYELMKAIPDGSIDAVISDFPYNTTNAETDREPFNPVLFWPLAKKVLKPNGIIITTSSQPFTTDLINSNRVWFKYSLVWEKDQGANFFNVKYQPYKVHEDIVIFSPAAASYSTNGSMTYNPIMKAGKPYKVSPANLIYDGGHIYKTTKSGNKKQDNEGFRYPRSVLSFKRESGFHPTQKPIALFEYLIKTYSNPGETILDPFCGSGTTALAAHNTGRNWICMEREEKYHAIANKRLALAQIQGRFEEMVG